MNLGQILEYLYPGIRLMPGPNADAILEDTGDGPQIMVWNLPDPQPSLAELAAVAAAAAEAALLADIRSKRNSLLIASDWSDAAPHLSRPQRKQWRIYRQQLRDITQQDPTAVEWPVPPDQMEEYNGYGWLVRLPLEEAREWARGEVNDQAGDRRCVYATNIPFQDALYLRKQQEAQGPMPGYPAFPYPGFLNDSEPGPDKYPVLYAEAAARGVIPAELAQEYAANAGLWPQVLAAIEAVRVPAGDAIRAAEDHETMIEVLNGLVWPM